MNYSVILKVPMMGSGGIANLQICQRAGINMLRDGSFVFSTQGYSSFTFDIKNKGVRLVNCVFIYCYLFFDMAPKKIEKVLSRSGPFSNEM